MIKKFLWKTLFGIFVWVAYTLEALWIITFLDSWLDLNWVTITTPSANPFLDGVGWVIGFVMLTLFAIFVTGLLIVEPED